MNAGALLIAMALDALFGEPRWLYSRIPHPAVLMGNVIGWADRRFNTVTAKRLKGVVLMSVLVLAMWCLGTLVEWISTWAAIVMAAMLLAQRSLVQHVQAVADALRSSTEEGRTSVAMIVGRDTRDMDDSAIARAAIESAAENFSDGVLAPAFWFLVGGLPALLIYKITNTADSMIGYRTERHAHFGWAAARLDDVLNLFPARLTALVLVAIYGLWGTLADIIRDAGRHRSPNAGWPEAAMARALGIAVAGPRSYDGELRDFPFVNADARRRLSANDIDAATRALWVTWAACAGLVFVLWIIGL